MIRRRGWLGLGLLLLACGSCRSPATSVEIRLAERTPQPGFLAMPLAGTDEVLYLAPHIVLSNADIQSAEFVGDALGKPAVEIQLTPHGTQTFADFTAAHVGDLAAIVVDGHLVSAPAIRARIAEGRAVIRGPFSEAEARDLAQSIVPSG